MNCNIKIANVLVFFYLSPAQFGWLDELTRTEVRGLCRNVYLISDVDLYNLQDPAFRDEIENNGTTHGAQR